MILSKSIEIKSINGPFVNNLPTTYLVNFVETINAGPQCVLPLEGHRVMCA